MLGQLAISEGPAERLLFHIVVEPGGSPIPTWFAKFYHPVWYEDERCQRFGVANK